MCPDTQSVAGKQALRKQMCLSSRITKQARLVLDAKPAHAQACLTVVKFQVGVTASLPGQVQTPSFELQ